MQNLQPYLIPLAIIIAGVSIAGAVVFTNSGASGAAQEVPSGPTVEQLKKVRPVVATEHIRGPVDAKVTLVEYSDFQCPFCGRFQPTLEQAMKEYEGKVRWVYRHLPLTQIHPNANPAALASECVAELGGNDAFWKMADGLIENQADLSDSLYEKLATKAGVALAPFKTCYTSKRHQDKIDADSANAQEIGASGTPFTVIMAEGKDPQVISGAYPYENLKSAIEKVL